MYILHTEKQCSLTYHNVSVIEALSYISLYRVRLILNTGTKWRLYRCIAVFFIIHYITVLK